MFDKMLEELRKLIDCQVFVFLQSGNIVRGILNYVDSQVLILIDARFEGRHTEVIIEKDTCLFISIREVEGFVGDKGGE